MIDPFSLNPTGPFDHRLAYWWSTWQRYDYEAPGFYDDTIVDLVGGQEMITFPLAGGPTLLSLIPRCQILKIDAEKCILNIRGTTTINPEVIGEILHSNLVPATGWSGLVSNYFSQIADAIWTRVSGSLTSRWIVSGHSLGGALAGLISAKGAEKVFTCGQPREGNRTYAQSRNNAQKLRLVNQGDPVPQVPFSTATILDDFPLSIPVPASLILGYRHWGTRTQVWDDGTLTLPPAQDEPWAESVSRGFLNLLDHTPFFDKHYSFWYTENIRRGIPIRFPLTVPDVDFPDLHQIDAMNVSMNEDAGRDWTIDGRGGNPPPSTVRYTAVEPPDFYRFVC